ncbi:transglycosylase SLT domain-containing protein [Nocardia wallacei]|uniref:transglycosylase SLT domain-containing protein n=1 Tax=Nocardia wallacei TaxID=480035 RepID=UPI00245481C1|nr:transglycosylase SLT domain-containing protein [Nocardia wallacei]
MATEYRAGQAKLVLRPALANGFRAQVKGLLKPINESLTVKVKPELTRGFRTQLRTMVKEASKGADARIGVKVDTRNVRSQVRNSLKELPDAKVRVKLDFTAADRQLTAWRAKVAANPLNMSVNVDTAAAIAQLAALRTLAGTISSQVAGIGRATSAARGAARQLNGGILVRPVQAIRLRVEVDRAAVAKAEADLAAISGRLQAARAKQADATDRVALAEARYAEIAQKSGVADSRRIAATNALARARRAEADAAARVASLAVDRDRADSRVGAARARQGAIGALAGAGFAGFAAAGVEAVAGGIGAIAKNLLSVHNLAMAAAVGLAAVAAVSLVPLIGQLAQAAGVLGLFPAAAAGAVAVFAAVKVGTSGLGDAFKAYSKVQESASEDAKAHAKAVQSARKEEQAAARGVESAQRGVQSANRGVQSAERGVRDAQRESLDAQKDLNRARQDATREIEELNRALGRTKLDEEGAAIAVAQAQRDLVRTLQDPSADPIDRASAQHRLNQALYDQQDTLRNTRDLQERANEANARGVEGADNVVAAKDRVARAAEGEADAQQRLSDAHVAVGDAQRDLADAQQRLIEAQQNTVDAINEGSAAAKDFEEKLAKLSPAARDFVQQMIGLKPSLDDLKNAVQESGFDKLGDDASRFGRNWIPTLKDGLSGIAAEINGGVRRALADLDTDATRSKVSTIFDNTKKSIGPVLDGINNLIQGFLSLSQVGSDFLPGISNGFLGLTERFRAWAESPEGQAKFKNFLEESLRTFGKIVDIAKELGKLIGNVFAGSDETGESWLDSIERTLKSWNAFLGTPEGQQKVKDFFTDVKSIVNGIVDAIKIGASILGTFRPAPENGKPANAEGKVPERLAPGDEDKAGGARQIWDAEDNDRGWLGKATRGFNSFFGYNNETDSYDGGVWRDDRWGGKIRGLSDSIMRLPNVAVGEGWGMVKAQWDAAKIAWKGLSDTIGGSAESVGGWLSGAKDKAVDFGQQAALNIGHWAVNAFNDFKNNLPSVAESVTNFVTDAATKLGGFQINVSGIIDVLTGDSVLGKFRGAFGELPGFFGGIVSGVGSAFGGIVGALHGPINAVIDLLNRFGELWNKIAGLLGLPEWKPIQHVGEQAPPAAGPQPGVIPQGGSNPQPGVIRRYARGGLVSGGIPGRDSVEGLLMPGEVVMSVPAVQAIGKDNLLAYNQAALKGKAPTEGMFAGRLAMAAGGSVQEAIDRAKNFMRGENGKPYQYGGVGNPSWDCSGLWSGIVNVLQGRPATSGRLFSTESDFESMGWEPGLNGPVTVGIMRGGGGPNSHMAGTLDGENAESRGGDGVLFGGAARGADNGMFSLQYTLKDFLGEFKSGGGGGITGLFNRGKNALIDKLFATPLRALVGQVPSFEGLGEFGKIPKAMIQKVVDEAIAFVKNKTNIGGSGGEVDYNATAGVEQWRELAKEAMRRAGFDPDNTAQLNAMLSQIQSESGGNPNAINLWDSNAQAGHPSQGLLQTIPSTFEAYRDPSIPGGITDPLANMVAALRYYRSRYGSDLTTQWGQGHGYDQGGIFPDKTWGINMSGLPEAVLTNPQWRLFRDFVQKLGADAFPGMVPQPPTPSVEESLNAIPGVDNGFSLAAKTQDRFKGAFETGLNDLASSFLGPLGLPDPREIPLVKGVKSYGEDLDAWHKARAASAQASQMLAQSGYQAAGSSPVGMANTVTGQGSGASGAQIVNDYSTTINLTAADVDSAYRKAEQIRDVRALQYTGRDG